MKFEALDALAVKISLVGEVLQCQELDFVHTRFPAAPNASSFCVEEVYYAFGLAC